MPVFQYTVRDSTGAMRMGTSEASNIDLLTSRLIEQGFTVKDIKPAKADHSKVSARFVVHQSERVQIWLLMSTLLDSQVSPLRALELTADQVSGSPLKNALMQVRADVGGGKTLSQAMQTYPNIFDTTAIGLIRAGEEGGTLKETVQRLLHHLEVEQARQHQTRLAWIQLLTGVLIALIVGLLLRSPG